MIDHAINHVEVTQEFIDSLPTAPELGLIDPPCVKFVGDQKLFLCAMKGRWVWATQITLERQYWPPDFEFNTRIQGTKSVILTADGQEIKTGEQLLAQPLTEGFTLYFAEEATAGWIWGQE